MEVTLLYRHRRQLISHCEHIPILNAARSLSQRQEGALSQASYPEGTSEDRTVPLTDDVPGLFATRASQIEQDAERGSLLRGRGPNVGPNAGFVCDSRRRKQMAQR